MGKLVYVVTLFACLAAVYFENASGCNSRRMGGDSTVCVCSGSLHCDGELEHTNHLNTAPGVVNSFTSSKAGARFEKHEHKFGSNDAQGVFYSEVKIDRSKRHQKIMGFGGAFTDSAGFEIGRLPKDLQGRLIKDYFGPDGIEYRLGRVTIGGSDFSTRGYSLDDHPHDESLSTFALQNEDYNYKMPFMRWAKEVSAHKEQIKWFGTAWSPPAWMKTNGQLNHGGWLKGQPGGKYYKDYAKYLVKFIQAYAKNNVSMWGLTVVNEPGFGNVGDFRYNCLGFTAPLQRDFIKLDLGPELHGSGLGHIAVMHYDHNVDHVEEYANTILGDHDAAKYVAGTAYHWYERQNRNFNKDVLKRVADKFPGKFLLATEACLGYNRNTNLGDWNNFNEYATDILEVLNHNVQGWVDWNMVLDMKGGPSWAGTVVDAPIHVSDDGHEYYKLPLYYALGHFSKFVLPDSVRLEHDLKHYGPGNNVDVTIFERPDKSIVLTAINKNNHKLALKVHDPERGHIILDLAADSMESHIWH